MDLNYQYPQQPSNPLSQSSFSINYDPRIITAYSANPNANIQGGINPTGNQKLSFQNNTTDNTQNTSATDITQPKIQNFTPNVGTSTSSSQQPSNPLNSNATSLLSFAAQKSGVGKSLMGGVTNSINDFGATLGFANTDTSLALQAGLGAQDAAALGSTAMGFDAAGDSVIAGSAADVSGAAVSPGLFGGATLSGTLGAAGLGFMGGGILANALGENATGGSIGGGIGAGIGFMVAGPIGALVGGIGGSLFGGMFGNNTPKTDVSQFNYNPGATNASPQLLSRGNGTNVGGQQAYGGFSPVLSQAAKDLGFTIDPKVAIAGGTNSLYGPQGQPAYIGANKGSGSYNLGLYGFNPKDPASMQTAYLSTIKSVAKASGYTDMTAIDNWFNDNYVNHTTMDGATNAPPSIPNNPSGQ